MFGQTRPLYPEIPYDFFDRRFVAVEKAILEATRPIAHYRETAMAAIFADVASESKMEK